MHFESGDSNKETRPAEVLHVFMFAKNVADVLTQKTLDAFTELLHAINIRLVHFPIGSRPWRKRRNLFVYAVVPGDVRDQIFDHGKRSHRLDGDGFVQGKGIHASLACEAGAAVDLRRTGTALS